MAPPPLGAVLLVDLLAGTLAGQRQTVSAAGRFLAAEEDVTLLAQTSQQIARGASRLTASSSAGASAEAQREPLKADWFDSFQQGESRYDIEADSSAQSSHGWEYKGVDPYRRQGARAREAAFYHESPSGGPREAWQTHFPAPRRSVATRGTDPGDWRMGQNGHWAQDYKPARVNTPGVKRAGWFDNSVRQYDGFGRVKSPIEDSPKFTQFFSQERSVNTTIACAEAGCEATTVLQAFNSNTENGANCKLSLFVHPTDFDDGYSGERISSIKVNGITVNSDCFPMISGCNTSTQTPMFSCLRDHPLEGIIDSTGRLNISARISDVVDECPYEGNLLSGVPIVTCLVSRKEELVGRAPPVPVPAVPVLREPPPEPMSFQASTPLRCMFRGCAATAELELASAVVERLDSCVLTMKIYPTDFDNEEGTNEALEYVQIDGVAVAQNVTPGLNPCRAAWAGKGVSLAERQYVALPGLDVTSNAARGKISVAAKITDHVDECAHDGYLLDGSVEMKCVLLPPTPVPA